jgi:hypothetical protein
MACGPILKNMCDISFQNPFIDENGKDWKRNELPIKYC